MGDLCIKIPGMAGTQLQVLLDFLEKHFNGPSYAVYFHHSKKG
jgi:hypothetical protein